MTSGQNMIAFFSCLVMAFVVSALPVHGQHMQFADLEYPYEVAYQEVGDGHRLAYVDEGSGDPLILIHGLGSYIPAWKKTIPELSKSHRVIALDLPGFGKSSKQVEAYSIAFFARTVVQLQDSLGIEKAIWAGHSMGAQIALEAAFSHPEKISKLVLLAPAGFETFSEQEAKMMSGFVTPASIKATPEPMIRQVFKSAFYKFPEDAQFMAGDRVAIREAEDFDLYAEAYAASVQAMLDGPVYSRLDEISQPTLVIFGKQDALIPNRQLHPKLTTREVAESGMRKLGNSRLKMVEEAGHFVHFEQPEAVNSEILNFIDNGS